VWNPKKDFADGGAFPEIHVAQFPLGMGKSKSGPQNQGTLALQTDETGQVRYDVVLHQESQQGTSGGKVVYAKHSDLAPMDVPNEGFAKPSDEELQETTDKTKEALSKIVDCKCHLCPCRSEKISIEFWC
jgi:SNW domain-containing protein 1